MDRKEDLKERIVIVDLDGCLAFNYAREHLILGSTPDWEEFYRMSIHDQVNQSLAEMLRCLRINFLVYVVSGRAEEHRAVYEVWLERNDIPYDSMILRPPKNFKEDHVLKNSYIGKHFEPDDVLCVFDSRPKAIEMWRSHGFICYSPTIFEM